jgi:subtilisin family serine protease
MPGELIVNAATQNVPFPEGTFLHSVDKPFEVWGVKLLASQSVNGGVGFIPIAAPAPNIDKFWRVRMRDLSKNQEITRAAQLVDSLVDNDDNVWWWTPEPYTIVRAEGFDVSVDNTLAVNFLRAEVTFRGYLLILEPPSETR